MQITELIHRLRNRANQADEARQTPLAEDIRLAIAELERLNRERQNSKLFLSAVRHDN